MIATDIFKGYYIKVYNGKIDINDTHQKTNYTITLWYNSGEEAWVLTNNTICINGEPKRNSISSYDTLGSLVNDDEFKGKFGWNISFYPEFRSVLLKYFCSVIQDTTFSYHVCRLYKKGKHGLYDIISKELCPVLTAIFDEFSKAAFQKIKDHDRIEIVEYYPTNDMEEENK